jgi:hypothetical protein
VHLSEQSGAVRFLVLGVLSSATAGMFAVSMRANYLYGFSIGQSADTQHAIAWANVGADLWKGFGLILVAALWRSARKRVALLTCATWLVCLSFSVSSAIGIYVQERTALTSGREAKHASFEDATKELQEIETKLRALTQHRTSAQLEAAIAGVLARTVVAGERVRGTVGALSNNCAKQDTRTAAACIEVAALREELAVAVEATRLETRVNHLRQVIQSLRERGAAAAPDPVGQFWTWITRGIVSVKDVSFGLPLFFALMIEMVSAFGPVGIVAYAEATRATSIDTDTGRAVAPRRAMARQAAPEHAAWAEVGHVVQYMADRTEPTSKAAGIGADELYGDYQLWCATKALQPLPKENFLEEFDRVRASPQLAGRIKKFGARYFGIAFVDSKDVVAALERSQQ